MIRRPSRVTCTAPRLPYTTLLLTVQCMNLPRLSGYLKFPDGFPAAPVTLVPRRWPRMAEGFIARAFGSAPGAHAADETNVDPSEWASLPAEAADGAPAANDEDRKSTRLNSSH